MAQKQSVLTSLTGHYQNKSTRSIKGLNFCTQAKSSTVAGKLL